MSVQADLKARYGLMLSEEGVEEVSKNLPTPVDVDAVWKASLDRDLRKIGGSHLPKNINTIEEETIKGPIVVQILSIQNIVQPAKRRLTEGPPRTLSIKFTDGTMSCHGIEFEYLNKLSTKTVPGTKVRLEKVVVKNGVLLLRDENITVLGGNVEKLVESWNRSKVHNRTVHNPQGSNPPKFEPFVPSKGKDRKNKQSKSASKENKSTENHVERKTEESSRRHGPLTNSHDSRNQSTETQQNETRQVEQVKAPEQQQPPPPSTTKNKSRGESVPKESQGSHPRQKSNVAKSKRGPKAVDKISRSTPEAERGERSSRESQEVMEEGGKRKPNSRPAKQRAQGSSVQERVNDKSSENDARTMKPSNSAEDDSSSSKESRPYESGRRRRSPVSPPRNRGEDRKNLDRRRNNDIKQLRGRENGEANKNVREERGSGNTPRETSKGNTREGNARNSKHQGQKGVHEKKNEGRETERTVSSGSKQKAKNGPPRAKNSSEETLPPPPPPPAVEPPQQQQSKEASGSSNKETPQSQSDSKASISQEPGNRSNRRNAKDDRQSRNTNRNNSSTATMKRYVKKENQGDGPSGGSTSDVPQKIKDQKTSNSAPSAVNYRPKNGQVNTPEAEENPASTDDGQPTSSSDGMQDASVGEAVTHFSSLSLGGDVVRCLAMVQGISLHPVIVTPSGKNKTPTEELRLMFVLQDMAGTITCALTNPTLAYTFLGVENEEQLRQNSQTQQGQAFLYHRISMLNLQFQGRSAAFDLVFDVERNFVLIQNIQAYTSIVNTE